MGLFDIKELGKKGGRRGGVGQILNKNVIPPRVDEALSKMTKAPQKPDFPTQTEFSDGFTRRMYKIQQVQLIFFYFFLFFLGDVNHEDKTL